jgi:hypothetical protein
MTVKLPFKPWQKIARSADLTADVLAIITHIGNEIDSETDWGVTFDPSPPSDSIAVMCKPPAGVMDDVRIIFAGYTSGTPDPPMAGDTATADYVLVTIVRGVTDDSGFSWNSANAGLTLAAGAGESNFIGYFRALIVNGDNHITIEISDEAIAIWRDAAANNTLRQIHVGAFVDPLSDAPEDCEENGRLYCLSCTSQGLLTSTLWTSLNATTAPGFLVGSGTANNPQMVVLNPRTTGFTRTSRASPKTSSGGNLGEPGTFELASQRVVLQPVGIEFSDTRVLGQLRGIWMLGTGLQQDKLLVNHNGDAVEIGSFISAGWTAGGGRVFYQSEPFPLS